jgi:hypothetical protein
MTTTPFEIKVVYDASRRKRGGAVVRSARTQPNTLGIALVVGALLNLAVAATMYYVTWWRVDPFMYVTFMTRVPVDVPREFAANPFGITSDPGDSTTEEPGTEASQDIPWGGKTAQWLIPVTGYGWLVLATASACAVALTGGSWLGLAGGTWVRMIGKLGMLTLITGAGYVGYKIWNESQMMYKPDQLRGGMGLLTLLLALLGLALAGRARRITTLAGLVVILGALGTATGIWLWTQSGALEPRYAAWSVLMTAFGIHGSWGIVLLLSARRVKI